MELAQDFRTLRSGQTEPAIEGVLLEWSGLYARLSAAHALRREFASGLAPDSLTRGRFSDWPVPGCDGLPRKGIVNRKNSTDRKAAAGNRGDSAGLVSAGGREQ